MDGAYLSALPSALVALDKLLSITYLNPAAENLFSTNIAQFTGNPRDLLLPFINEQQLLIERVFASSEEMVRHEVPLHLPHGKLNVTLYITPVISGNHTKEVLLTIIKGEGLQKLTASEWKKDITRAAGVMASMLAHEVKNPLSGIRGAAQLLKDEVEEEHKPLAELIYMETDRIRDLLAQVDIFAESAPVALSPVNIHEVLQYVIAVARSGFARQVVFVENYDPSLPLVSGHRERLVQLFLNLIKNAAEAMGNQQGAEIVITTSYRSGYVIRDAGTQRSLPIMVSIHDNGPGVEEGLYDKLFQPFHTSKGEGRGLGLAIVAKIATDMGAVTELDHSAKKGAKFNVMLACAE